jgi:hypothetical protein
MEICVGGGPNCLDQPKGKVNLPLGSEYDCHHPNKVNYSIPSPTIMTNRAHIKSLKHNEIVVSYTTNMLESSVQNHSGISLNCLSPSKKECQALQANTCMHVMPKLERINMAHPRQPI